MANYKETTTVVNELIQVHNEREAGYKKASEWVENFHAKELFLQYKKQCSKSIEELMPFTEEYEKDKANNLLESLFQGWAEIEKTISKKDVKAIYAWCELGEVESLRRFSEAFREEMPVEIGQIVKKQFRELKESHCYIKALRDL